MMRFILSIPTSSFKYLAARGLAVEIRGLGSLVHQRGEFQAFQVSLLHEVLLQPGGDFSYGAVGGRDTLASQFAETVHFVRYPGNGPFRSGGPERRPPGNEGVNPPELKPT